MERTGVDVLEGKGGKIGRQVEEGGREMGMERKSGGVLEGKGGKIGREVEDGSW